MEKITQQQAKELIENSGSKIFTVFFRKKDGSLRRLIGRKGVTSYLKGGVLKYDPKALGYTVVFDMEKRDYRMVNLNTLELLHITGRRYEVLAHV